MRFGAPKLFALFGRIAPARIVEPISEEELDRYGWWSRQQLFPLLIAAPCVGYGCFVLLRAIAHRIISTYPTPAFVVAPPDLFWGIPAIFLGAIGGAYPVSLLYRRTFGPRFQEVEDAWYGFDAERIYKGILVCCAVGVVIVIPWTFSLTRITRVTGTGIAMTRGMRGATTMHTYDHVRRISHFPTHTRDDKGVVWPPGYTIRFDDGTSWTYPAPHMDDDESRDRALAEFVAAKSGVRIVEKE